MKIKKFLQQKKEENRNNQERIEENKDYESKTNQLILKEYNCSIKNNNDKNGIKINSGSDKNNRLNNMICKKINSFEDINPIVSQY